MAEKSTTRLFMAGEIFYPHGLCWNIGVLLNNAGSWTSISV